VSKLDSKEKIGYVTGFIDAEASFSISIKIQKDLAYGIRLDPVFSITQAKKEPLEIIAQTIGAGRITKKPGQKHLYLLIIDNMKELTEKLIPFLDKHEKNLYSKKEHYKTFREIVLALKTKQHKNKTTLKKLVYKAYLLSKINPKSHRKRTLEEIITLIDSKKRRRDLPGER